jgi:hypothetical protein
MGTSGAFAARPVHRTTEFTLSAGSGFRVLVQGRDDGVSLAVWRRNQIAIYAVPGWVSRAGDVKARFGNLGRISVAFEPDRSVPHPCRNVSEGTEGVFVGRIRFRGERHYLGLDADRARGNADVPAVAPSCKPKSGESAPKRSPLAPRSLAGRARSLAEEIEEIEEEEALKTETAYLTARSSDGVSFVASGLRRGPKAESSFTESKVERRGRMIVLRGATVFTRSTTAFTFDAQLESAILSPPKPIHGEATLRREPDGTIAWAGSLSVPIFGGDRVALTRPDVVAKLIRKIPSEE